MSATAAGDRPRVAIVPEWYPSDTKPVRGTFVREQARAIAPYADVAVVYCDPDEVATSGLWSARTAVEDGIRVVRVGLAGLRPRQLGTAVRMRAVDASIAALERDGFRPDVLHAHVFSAAVPALLAARRRRRPLVVSEHYTGVSRGRLSRWDRLVARVAYTGADLTCPVSEDLGRAVAGLAPRARLRKVPNSVDAELFAATRDAQRDPGGPRLLTVAMLTELKGIVHLLRAVPELLSARPTLRLDIVGDGPDRAGLERLAEELGIASAVTFHGQLERERVAERMRAADLFVLPSLWENLPCVIIEALASGLPVVATRVGGVPELVTAETGLLAEPGNSRSLGAALQQALDRLDGAGWDGFALSEAARARYGHDAVGREWIDVYRLVRS